MHERNVIKKHHDYTFVRVLFYHFNVTFSCSVVGFYSYPFHHENNLAVKRKLYCHLNVVSMLYNQV